MMLLLHYNSLTGTIPRSLDKNPLLFAPVFSYNILTGTIPTELGQIQRMTILDLGENGLTGSLPSELGSPRNLTMLSVNDNYLTGTLPKKLNRTFVLINLFNTQISGVIPESICWSPQLFHECNELLCGCSCNCTVHMSYNETEAPEHY